MSGRRYTYDEACLSLAAHFLAGERIDEGVVWDMAQAFQNTADDWFGARAAKEASEAMPSDENTIPGPPIEGERT